MNIAIIGTSNSVLKNAYVEALAIVHTVNNLSAVKLKRCYLSGQSRGSSYPLPLSSPYGDIQRDQRSDQAKTPLSILMTGVAIMVL